MNRNDVKVAYIGGGSRGWARTFMYDLAVQESFCGVVNLYDIDKDAAECNRIIGERIYNDPRAVSKWKYRVCETLDEALKGVDFVMISILPGTFDEMHSDVHTPEKFGIYQSVGDTAGPGGIVRAMRTIPMYEVFADAIARCCPDAFVINFTNPMTLCTRTLYDVFPKIKAFGCCHEVFGTQRFLAEVVEEMTGEKDIPRQEIKTDVIGINQPDFFDEIVNYDTNTNIRFNNANWVEVFEKTQQIGTDYVDSDIYGLDYSFAATYFSIGNTTNNTWYPMMIDGTWVNSQITAEFEVGAFALPAVDNPTNAEGKKNLSVKTGATLSVFNRSNKKDAAQDYIEIFFRDEIYQKFVDFAKTPSVKETVEQTDTLVNSIFDENKYTFVEAYDSRMPRYFPLVSASEVVALMKGQITAQTVADTLQNQVELNKVDWQEYTQLSHTNS